MVRLLGFLDLLAGLTAGALWLGVALAWWLPFAMGAYLVGKGVWFVVYSRDWGSMVDIVFGVALLAVVAAGKVVAPVAGIEAIVLVVKGSLSLYAR